MLHKVFKTSHLSKIVNTYSLWTGLTDGYEYRHGTQGKKILNTIDTALSFIAFTSLGANVLVPLRNYCLSASFSYIVAEHVKKDLESAQAVFSLRSTGS